MPIVRTPSLSRAVQWMGHLVDELVPPGHTPEGAADWQPDTTEDYCPRCGASAGPGSVTPHGCPFCLKLNFPWHRITRLGFYGEPVDDWIRDLKFHRRWRYGQWMGKQLANALPLPLKTETTENETSGGAQWMICPVPMHKFRCWHRGYNQADLIARAAAKSLGLTCAPILKRVRHTPPQTAIAPSRRHDNVRNSFDIEKVDLAEHDVILMDDVKTTGATLSACTRLLIGAGARSVHAAVVAVADPKGQGFSAL